MRFIAVCVLVSASVSGSIAFGQGFTLDQALSAPYASDLVASQKTRQLRMGRKRAGQAQCLDRHTQRLRQIHLQTPHLLRSGRRPGDR